MTIAQRIEQINRDAIMKLLTNEEAARVGAAESRPCLEKGVEFIDLQNTGLGIQRAISGTMVAPKHALWCDAVSDATWSTIKVHMSGSRL